MSSLGTTDSVAAWARGRSRRCARGAMVATINAALRAFAIRRQARDIIAAFDQVQVDFTDSDHAWRYGGGRNLSRFAEDAREADTV